MRESIFLQLSLNGFKQSTWRTSLSWITSIVSTKKTFCTPLVNENGLKNEIYTCFWIAQDDLTIFRFGRRWSTFRNLIFVLVTSSLESFKLWPNCLNDNGGKIKQIETKLSKNKIHANKKLDENYWIKCWTVLNYFNFSKINTLYFCSIFKIDLTLSWQVHVNLALDVLKN